MLRFAISVVCLYVGVVLSTDVDIPEKCCAPPAFEIEIKSSGHMDFGIPEYNKVRVMA